MPLDLKDALTHGRAPPPSPFTLVPRLPPPENFTPSHSVFLFHAQARVGRHQQRAAAMSDDFLFDDDIILDEAALAILDAEESKYFGSVANVQSHPRPAPTQSTPPPAKRQRTDDDGGWKHPATGISSGGGKLTLRNQKRSDSFYEDLPDISLAGDGVYGVLSQGSRPPQNSNPTSVKTVKNPLGQRSLPVGFQQPVPAPAPSPLPRERTSGFNQNRPPPRPPPPWTHTPPNRPQPQQQNRQQQSSHPQQQNQNQTRGPVPAAGSFPPQSIRPQNLGHGRNVNIPRQQQQARRVTPALSHPSQARPSIAVGGGTSTDKDLQDEVTRLRVQLEQVRGHGVNTFDLYH